MQEVVTVLHDGKAPPETLATLLQVSKHVAGEIRQYGSGSGSVIKRPIEKRKKNELIFFLMSKFLVFFASVSFSIFNNKKTWLWIWIRQSNLDTDSAKPDISTQH
jgi:hypothetical protein